MARSSIGKLKALIAKIDAATKVAGGKKGYVIMMNGRVTSRKNKKIIKAVLDFPGVSWYVISSTTNYNKNLKIGDVTSHIEFKL